MAAWNGLYESRLRRPWMRTIVPVFLISMAAAIAVLLVPAGDLHAQSPPRSAKDSTASVVKKSARRDTEPFDLSFMPADVKKLVAARPAAILRSLGGRKHEITVLSLFAPQSYRSASF